MPADCCGVAFYITLPCHCANGTHMFAQIMLINMQLFSQFKQANIIEWPQMVSDYMGSFTSFSFDLLKLTAFECLMKTDFFFSFFFVAAFPFAILMLLAFIHFFGRCVFYFLCL